jgi:hypothetical protein
VHNARVHDDAGIDLASLFSLCHSVVTLRLEYGPPQKATEGMVSHHTAGILTKPILKGMAIVEPGNCSP